MTNSVVPTNGASLEDCHTNFFALVCFTEHSSIIGSFFLMNDFSLQTDLCGIKWSRYTALESVVATELIGDPILGAYARCIESDVLCVWRRAPGATRVPLIEQKKELWLFWYGELTDVSSLVGDDLNGSYTK